MFLWRAKDAHSDSLNKRRFKLKPARNERSKKKQERLVGRKWKEEKGGNKVRSFPRVSSYLVRDSCRRSQSGKYQVSSISGEGISRYKSSRTYEIREEGEKETRKLGTTVLIRCKTRHRFFE